MCKNVFAAFLLMALSHAGASQPGIASFCSDWRFSRTDESAANTPAFDDNTWEAVTLPHTARIEALVAGKNNPQWQGICWYRKSFSRPTNARDKQVLLRFDGAMNTAEVWVISKVRAAIVVQGKTVAQINPNAVTAPKGMPD